MAKGILDMLIDAFWTDERVGKLGEKLTERELKLVRLLGRKGKILKNIYLPKEEGGTSEIDFVYSTPKGIFVIESKNYSGWIFGDEKSAYWTVSLPNGQKNRFYSPVKQNQTHIKWLNLYLESHGFQDVPMYSLIVFSERCEIKKMSVTAKKHGFSKEMSCTLMFVQSGILLPIVCRNPRWNRFIRYFKYLQT